MAFPYRTGDCRYLFLRVRCFNGNTRYRHLRNEQLFRRLVFQPSIGGVQKTGEAIKEAVVLLRSIIRRKRIGKLRSRISAASGGAFIDFALDDNGIISCVKQRRDIPCVSVSGIPYLYSEDMGWRVSPYYLQNVARWQQQYEPVIQSACIEASANGLEIVRIDRDTGKIMNSDFAVTPIAGMEEIIRRTVSGDIMMENNKQQLVLRWDEYPDE